MTVLCTAKERIFILGCERSGSTWLANIFDAHPDVELIMEPFADYAGLFPGFPDRNTYLSGRDSELIEIIKREYGRLCAAKYPLFYKPGRSPYLKILDGKLVAGYVGLLRHLGACNPRTLDQYQLLNLNASEVPVGKQPTKNIHRTHEVTKELRLNFKIGFLSKLFPTAKYLVAIRHPGAQISSIMQLFKRGHLTELQRSLLSFVEHVNNGKRFINFWNSASSMDYDNDLEAKLALWWIINYGVLIEDLQLHRLDYRIVYHEELCKSPDKTVGELFEFCDLNYDAQAKAYVRASSTENSNGTSPLNTSRDSANYYKLAIERVSISLNKKIQKIILPMKAANIEPSIYQYLGEFYDVKEMRA
jgi:hypothetical protein